MWFDGSWRLGRDDHRKAHYGQDVDIPVEEFGLEGNQESGRGCGLAIPGVRALSVLVFTPWKLEEDWGDSVLQRQTCR